MSRTRGTGRRAVGVAAAVLVVLGCACSSPKAIEYYQPDVAASEVEEARRDAPDVVLAVQDFSTDAAYDEKRIVYRQKKYGFNYYHYHRWAAPPGMLVSDALRKMYRESGVFESVVGGYSPRADVVAMGRVTSIEEVDISDETWKGRIGLDVQLRDAETGQILWSNSYLKEKTMEEKSPSGLTAAISEGLVEIAAETAPIFGEVGEKHLREEREAKETREKKKEKREGTEEGWMQEKQEKETGEN